MKLLKRFPKFQLPLALTLLAAVLLSGFTDRARDLLIGVNLGGLGTLIASMASLISYKYMAKAFPREKGKYLLWFTVANVVFLILLLILWILAY